MTQQLSALVNNFSFCVLPYQGKTCFGGLREKKKNYSKYPKFRIMSEHSQESRMERAYEEVKISFTHFSFGLNYFSYSKNKKGHENMAML